VLRALSRPARQTMGVLPVFTRERLDTRAHLRIRLRTLG